MILDCLSYFLCSCSFYPLLHAQSGRFSGPVARFVGCNILDVSEYKCVWRSQAPLLPHLKSSPGFHVFLRISNPSNARPSFKSWWYEEVNVGRQVGPITTLWNCYDNLLISSQPPASVPVDKSFLNANVTLAISLQILQTTNRLTLRCLWSMLFERVS